MLGRPKGMVNDESPRARARTLAGYESWSELPMQLLGFAWLGQEAKMQSHPTKVSPLSCRVREGHGLKFPFNAGAPSPPGRIQTLLGGKSCFPAPPGVRTSHGPN